MGNSKLTKLYQNIFSLAKRFKDDGMTISASVFQSSSSKSEDFLTNMVGMDFNLFCFVETVKTFEAKSETDRYGPESTGFHSNTEEAREYLKKVVGGFYKREYQDQLKLKEGRVKAAKLQGFLLSFRTMPFKEFVIQLQENVPNQTSMGITELLELIADDVKSMVDPVSKVELLLTGRFEESTWNNGSVARESSGLLLKLLEQIVPAERFAIVKEHVRRFSWHRYRGADDPGSDQTNRHGYGNLRPSFWAATGHSDPWAFYGRILMATRCSLILYRHWRQELKEREWFSKSGSIC